MKRSKLTDLTTEQLDALLAYAAWGGEGWRNKLRADWLRGGSRWPGEWAPLQQVRNQHIGLDLNEVA